MYDFDHDLFLALNFDGGPTVDRIMFTISGTTMWIPLYLLILWMVWRRGGWRDTLLFFVLMVGAIVLSDMLCGMFKANGVMGELLPDFQPRWRPMFTPELEELAITPDSLYVIRQTGMAGDWAVHVPVKAVAGHYGTVSAHAATIVTLAVLSCAAIRRRWFTALMVVSTVAICYSRIYLGKHFPMDLVWGALVGGILGYAAWRIFRHLSLIHISEPTRPST